MPPLGYLFAAFLGYNPLKKLLGPAVLATSPRRQAGPITSRAFFPQLIGPPFKHALALILIFAVVMCVIAAIASALRGEKFIHVDEESIAQKARMHHGHVPRIRHGGGSEPLPADALGVAGNGPKVPVTRK